MDKPLVEVGAKMDSDAAKPKTKPNMPPVPRANCNAHIIGNWTATFKSVSLHQKDTQMC